MFSRISRVSAVARRTIPTRPSLIVRAHNPEFSMASSPCCAAGKPVVVDYTPAGTFSKIPSTDFDSYITGSGNNGPAIIVVYDIFGFNFKQVLQVCDRFADAGYMVIAPDLFHGKPWLMENFPPKEGSQFMEWITKEGDYEKCMKDINAVIEHLKAEKSVTKFGIAGFCWGGSIALRALGAVDTPFSAGGGFHAALFGQDKQIAEQVSKPMFLLQADGDNMEEIQEVISSKPFADKCVFKRFDGQTHGFVAARGDWSKPEVAAAAGEAIQMASTFFKSQL